MNEAEKKRLMLEWWRRHPRGIAAAYRRGVALVTKDISDSLAGMSDKGLADWNEAELKKDAQSAECILAEQEWAARGIARQIEGARTTMFLSAVFGAVFTLIAILIVENLKADAQSNARPSVSQSEPR